MPRCGSPPGIGTLGVLVVLGSAVEPVPVRAQPVGSEFQINTYTTGRQRTNLGGGLHQVAADASGNFVVVWESNGQDGEQEGVFGQRYDSLGGALGSEFRVNSFTSSIQNWPSIASDTSGNFVVVWTSFGQGIVGQRYDSEGVAQGGEFLVVSHTTGLGDQILPSVASDASGNFVVVWMGHGQDGSGDGIVGQRYDSAGGALGSNFQVNSYSTGYQRWPSVASDATGNFVVVWLGEGQVGYSADIFGQRYDSAGGPLGSEFQVNSYTTGTQWFPSIASDASGNFVVAWMSVDGSNSGIFGQRYDSGGMAQGDEFQVNSYTTGSQVYPSVASHVSGNFVVVWNSSGQDGSQEGIFGQRYDSAGVAQGDEFQINSYTTDRQRMPSVGATGNQFVVAWGSDGQDGGGGAFDAGVFGQRFSFVPDFTLSCNPSTLSIPQGESGNSTCGVGSVVGFNDPVTLSCTGLPNGASCSFNPNPATPPPDDSVNSTLTVSVTKGTPLGSYPFQAQGVSGALSNAFNMTLEVTPGELLVNGGFEVSRVPWVFAGPGALYLTNGPLPHSGTGYAQLGGGNSRVGYAYQQVSIPSTAPADLTFWLNVTSSETTLTKPNDKLTVEVRNKSGVLLATLGTFSNLDKSAPGNYTQKAFSMAAFKGQTVRLVFRVATNPSLPTTFRVDDVSLK